MKKNYEDDCNMMIQMIAETEQKTLSVLSGIDPEKVVYNDDPIWRGPGYRRAHWSVEW